MKKIVIGLIILFISIASAWGDTIRGPYGGTIELNESGTFSQEIRLKLEDVAAVQLGNVQPELVKAIELEVKIPNAVRKYRDSFALFFYRNIHPKPGKDTTSYRGEQAAFEIIPYRNRVYFQLPVKTNVSLPVSPDTVGLSKLFRPDHLPLIITILPVMKGIPSFIASSEFRIRGRALLEESGRLEIKLSYPEEESHGSFTIFIDGKLIDIEERIIPLAVGIHSLSLTSDVYRPAVMNFGIETGKETVLDISLEKQVPRIFMEKPEGTIVFIDGEKIDLPSGAGMEISEGEHTVLFKLGDYSLSKKVYIERGKDYDISLFMDIIVRDKE